MKFNFKKTSEILAESGLSDEQMNYETPAPGAEDLVYNEETGDYDYPEGDLMLDTIQRHIAAGDTGYPKSVAPPKPAVKAKEQAKPDASDPKH